MRGLVAYDEDSLSDHDDQPPAEGSNAHKSTPDLNARPVPSSDQPTRNSNNSSSSKPAVIIRRHAPAKPHLRTRLPDDGTDDHSPAPQPSTRSASHDRQPASPDLSSEAEPSDELTRIRRLLRPPPIPGVQDWGIPPEPDTPCDEAIKAKITSFLALKRDPHNPRHFNDSLMANRAFRNPHLYAKLVEFVDVDERTTNFPKRVWDPTDVRPEWYADEIAEAQKVRSEAAAAAQGPGKRTHIDFASSALAAHRSRAAEAKAGRFQPYNVPPRPGAAPNSSGGGVLGGGYSKAKGRSRWG